MLVVVFPNLLQASACLLEVAYLLEAVDAVLVDPDRLVGLPGLEQEVRGFVCVVRRIPLFLQRPGNPGALEVDACTLLPL